MPTPLHPVFTVLLVFGLFCSSGGAWAAPAEDTAVPADIVDQARVFRDQAVSGSAAFAIAESLTTEVGARLAGTEAEARARAWSLAKLAALGFSGARVEPFTMTTWVRGAETGSIISPFPQNLYLTALGTSGSTGPEGLRADLAVFDSLADLEAVPDGSLGGKIAYVGHAMKKTQDGAHYGFFGGVRRQGPGIAARKGAAAILIRSVGTDQRRFPHTGATAFPKDIDPIPAAAVSNPDADQIERIHARGETITVQLTLTPRVVGETQSGNVIVDIPGTDLADQIVVVGGHLDSWDLGTGAVDDGAGVAITTAAAKIILDSGLRPRRTIRLIHWGAEEVGLLGGFAYAKAHADSLDRHMIGGESDFGGERVYRLTADVSDAGNVVIDQMMALLAPLGISRRVATTTGGPDLIPLSRLGVPGLGLDQDGTDYFDLHHTPDDTLDKLTPAKLNQNVAAYTVFMWLAANTDADFRKPAPAP